jgi:hypothetical protein
MTGAMVEMATGDTNVGSTPTWDEAGNIGAIHQPMWAVSFSLILLQYQIKE